MPVNLALGATWNPALAAEGFKVCARQLAEQKVDMALVSMLDILRDPRWGRSEECYSEDPCLSSKMAEAITKAFLSEGIDVVAKHCCAQGETTGGTNASAALLGERELREIHLPAVKSAVEAGALGVMAAYNEIDGIPCHANSWLLRKVLRNEYGFKGIVMADGRAVDRLNIVADSPAARGAEALRAGVDLSLWDEGFAALETAVNNGLIDEKLIDEAVLRVRCLKAFTKIMLEPDEKRQCVLTLCADDLKLWDKEMRFTAEPGIFDIPLFEGANNFWKGEFTLTL